MTKVVRLSNLVLGPIQKHLTNALHLIICPDGLLSRIPFEMLMQDGKYLIEQKAISYVSSGREVGRLTQSESVLHGVKSFAYGNPDFDFDLAGSPRREEIIVEKTGIQDPESETAVAAEPKRPSLSRDFQGFKFRPLPGSESEARNVANVLGDECVVRLRAYAREAELKAMRSPRVLHLATHGFFLEDQQFKHNNPVKHMALLGDNLPSTGPRPERVWENPMIRCGIALAGANLARQVTNGVAEDGLLTGLEASMLNLHGTELVILSACDSGSGEIKIGEGIMSLRRAFRIAGAETVLASHWKVSDQATSLLMTEFMRRWRAGAPKVQAWREAQLSLLRSQEFSHPFFWAAFTLTGRWR